MRPKALLFLFCVLFFQFSFGQSGSDQPNILMLVIDDYNDYSGILEGHPQVKTPNLDKLMRSGVEFRNANCNGLVSKVSRASFMSGKDLEYTKVYNDVGYEKIFREIFRPEQGNEVVYTLPEILKDSAGYFTYGINKIFFGWAEQGYDNDYRADSLEECSKDLSWNRFIDFPSLCDIRPDVCDNHGFPQSFYWGYIPDEMEDSLKDKLTADYTIDFLEQYAEDQTQFCDKPFFLATGFWKPHAPYFLPERYFPDWYIADADSEEIPYNFPSNANPPNGVVMPPQPPEGFWADYDALPDLATHVIGKTHDTFYWLSDSMWPHPQYRPGLDSAARTEIYMEAKRANAVMGYLAAVHYVDDQIGRVMHTLRETGLDSNTIIVVFSDHGYHLGEKKKWFKLSMWEKVTHVPFAIIDPRQEGGRVSYENVSLIDVMPTILDFAGIDPASLRFPDGSKYLDGQSLKERVTHKTADPGYQRPALSTYRQRQNYSEINCFSSYSVRDREYHYIRYRSNNDGEVSPSTVCDFENSRIQEELYHQGYDRQYDRPEWDNLAGDPAYDDLKEYLSQWMYGEPLYGKFGFSAELIYEAPCRLADTGRLDLQVQLLSRDGRPIEIPEGFLVEWSHDGGGSYSTYGLSGSNWTIDLAGVADLYSAGRLAVNVRLTDTATGIFAHDLALLDANPDLVPWATFSVERDAVSAVVVDPVYAGPWKKAVWDFGDGFSVEDDGRGPAPHMYSSPGEYTITLTLYHGSDMSCYETISRGIIIPPGQFNGQCATPQFIALDRVSPDRAELHWGATWKADGYRLFYRELTPDDRLDWMEDQTQDAATLLLKLNPDTEYEFAVQAVCGPAESDVAYPSRFLTKPCRAPKQVWIPNPQDEGISVSWSQSPDEFDGYELGFLGGFEPVFESINDTSAVIRSLQPGTQYEVRVAARCEEIVDSVYVGPYSGARYFKTTGTPPDPPEVPNLAGHIVPNPATGLSTIIISSLAAGDLEVVVFDMTGAKLGRVKLQIEAGEHEFPLDVSGYMPGVYFAELRVEDEKSTVRFVVGPDNR